MARRHRKLFPISANQTADCPDSCDPACSFNCYPFPYYYYYSSPPPPAPLPPSPITSANHHTSPNNHASLYLIILASLFGGLFLLAAYFVITKTYSFFCCCCNNQGHSPSLQDNTNEEFLDENQVDHPIWYIATVGLQQSIINSITICRYKKAEGLVEGTECSVCLGEFQEGETLRLLPKCSHAFHITCVDTWLRSHTNCPLCRATIVSNNAHTEIYMPALPAVNLQNNNSNGNEEAQIENSGNHGFHTIEIVSGVTENRGGTGHEGEPQESNDESNFKQNVHDNTVTVFDDSTDIHPTDSDQIEVMNITVSKDSSSDTDSHVEGPVNLPARNIIIHERAEENSHAVTVREHDGESSSLITTMSHSSLRNYFHVTPVPMKRSHSCGGRITYHER